MKLIFATTGNCSITFNHMHHSFPISFYSKRFHSGLQSLISDFQRFAGFNYDSGSSISATCFSSLDKIVFGHLFLHFLHFYLFSFLFMSAYYHLLFLLHFLSCTLYSRFWTQTLFLTL